MSLAVRGASLNGEVVGLRCEQGRIVELGPGVEPRSGDEVVDGTETALVPGLVNGHTHAAMTLFRGYADDLPLMEWLEQHIWPAELRLDDDDVYWGTRLACVEMIRSGTTHYWDMYWKPGAAARAAADAGLRATVAPTVIDGADAARSAKLLLRAAQGLDEIEEAARGAGAGDRIKAALGPHAIYTVSEESLRGLAELAGERGVPIHIHLSETENEVVDCVGAHGLRPAHYLAQAGVLGEGVVLAHGVWLDEDELDLVAERGATVVTNPVANLKLAVGRVFPYLAARERGVRVGLGTDGPGSNNSLDVLADVKVFALLQKQEARDPTAVTAGESWEIATGRRSPLLAGAPLAVGEPADFLLVRTTAPELALGDLFSDLVYAASAAVVDSTVVAGSVLMRGGEIAGVDEVIERVRERARRLGLG